MDKLSEHAIRMLEIEGKGKNDGYIETRNMGDIARAVYDTILQVQVLKTALLHKTEPSDSEILNDCDTCIHRDEPYDEFPCDGCSKANSNYEPKDEPQTCGTCEQKGRCDRGRAVDCPITSRRRIVRG